MWSSPVQIRVDVSHSKTSCKNIFWAETSKATSENHPPQKSPCRNSPSHKGGKCIHIFGFWATTHKRYTFYETIFAAKNIFHQLIHNFCSYYYFFLYLSYKQRQRAPKVGTFWIKIIFVKYEFLYVQKLFGFHYYFFNNFMLPEPQRIKHFTHQNTLS